MILFIPLLLFSLASAQFSGTLNAFTLQNSLLHIYTVTSGPIVSFRLSKTGATGAFPSMLMVGGLTDPGPANRNLLFHISNISNFMDYQSMYTDKDQYVNIRAVSGQIYIRVIDLLPTVLNKRYTITITEGNALSCRSCFPPSIPSFGSSCMCSNCPNNYFGFYCDIPYTILQENIPYTVNLFPALFYFLVIDNPKTPTVTYTGTSIQSAIAFQYTNSLTQLAAIPNVALTSASTYAFYPIRSTFDQVQFLSQSNSISIGIYYGGSSPATVTLSYTNQQSSSSVLIIVMSILGGLLFLGVVVGVVCVALKFRNAAMQSQMVVPVEESKFSSDEIERYYPAVVYHELQKEKGEDCVICLCAIEEKDVVRVVYCGHVFHSTCLLNWFRKHLNCPYCRQECDKGSTVAIYEEVKQNSSNMYGVELARVMAARRARHEDKEESSKINIVSYV